MNNKNCIKKTIAVPIMFVLAVAGSYLARDMIIRFLFKVIPIC